MRGAILLFALMALVLLAVSAAGTPFVRLRYATFDPLVSTPSVPADLRSTETPGQSTSYLVQFIGPIEESWKASLTSLGAEIEEYIPDYAFIVTMTPEVARQAAKLANVRWVGLFHPAYRISPDIAHSTGTGKIVVRMFHRKYRAGVEAEVKRQGGSVDPNVSADSDCMDVSLPAKAMKQLAHHVGVAWIEPRAEAKLFNDVGRGIMTAPTLWSGIGLYGSGEIVGVCDTGLDTGDLTTISADFAGRVFNTYALGRKKLWDDPDGHGTHVCGSVLGSGSLSGSTPATHSYTSSFAGVAPEAQVVFQSIVTSTGALGGIPSDLQQLFLPPYSDGARVHTNSWGFVTTSVYSTDSRNLDAFIWNHRDMSILFAAGNEAVDANSDGVIDLGSITPPATAKNCICVGATENNRLYGGAQGTYGQYWGADYPADPIYSDKVSNNPLGIAAFSGRGPCSDGRIKPDICAPGTNIISTRSHVSGSGTLWGVYNTDYLYCGGTSMSTPLTAGAAALVRQFYRTQKGIMPSAALIKATLINGAKDVTPGQYGTGAYLEVPARPNNVEGWGRVDLAYSLLPTGFRDVRYVDNTTGLSTGGVQNYTYSITGSTSPLRVTLVWNDYPGSTTAATALVNDLDLTVIQPNGTPLYGNGGDHLNNVEGVDIASPAIGTYTIRVNGTNVPYGPQPYAVVVSGDMLVPPPTAAITAPPNGTQLKGSVDIRGTASGTDFQQYVLHYGAGSSPTTWTQIGSAHTTPVTNGLLGIFDATPLPDGVYTIRLTATNSAGSSIAYTTFSILTTRLSQAKGNINGTTVTLTGQVVSAGKPEFGTYMYVQEPDRSSGIRVNLGSVQTSSVIGSLVTVTGTLDLVSGERLLYNPILTTTGSATGPKPLGLTNRDIGGGALNAYTPGITGGSGTNNIGLLVTTFGRVKVIGTDYFYMDDGSALDDGSGNPGIKVYTGSLTKPVSTSQYAIVTGISSAEISGSTTRRLIRPRKQTDLVYY